MVCLQGTKIMTENLDTENNNTEEQQRCKFDLAWKNVIEQFFPQFMEYYFQDIAGEIDWEQGYSFRDNELQSIERPLKKGKSGLRRADKLVSVKDKSGAQNNIMLHIEIQDCDRQSFGERMYMYHYRLYDRYKKKFDDNEYETDVPGESLCDEIVSIALLSDLSDKKPSGYEYSKYGCHMNFKFPVVKLTDYEKDISDLENLKKAKNPFAIATAIHLNYKRGQKKKSATKNPETVYQELLECKFSVVRALIDSGFSRKEVKGFFDFMEMILQLPQSYELQFNNYVNDIKSQKNVEGKVNVLDELIEDGRIKGVVLGEVKGILKMAEKGHMSFKVAKAELEAFRNQIKDQKFWAEVDEKLKEL
jgi:hypothetical protein